MILRYRWLAAISLALAGVACASSDPTNTSTGMSSAQSDDRTEVYRTIVRRAADGTEQVNTDVITLQEQAREAQIFNARHEAIARGERIPAASVVHDTTCASSDVMIWDEASYSGDEICFYDSGGMANTYLPNYEIGCGFLGCFYWHGSKVISYKTNSQYGCFCSSGSTTVCATSWNFGTSQSDSNTNGEISGADYLWLDVTGCGTSSPTR